MPTRKRVEVQFLTDLGMQVLFSIWGYDVTVYELLASVTSLIGVGLGITGHEELVIGLTPVVTPDPTPVVPPATAGLHDWGTGLRAAMS